MSRGLTRGYDPTLTYNLVRLPWLETVVSGLPDGWAEAQNAVFFTPSTVLRVGSDGIPCADVTLTGTPSGTSAYTLVLTGNEVPATVGEQFAADIGACVLPGGVMGTAGVRAGVHEMNGGSVIAGIISETVVPTAAEPVRVRASRTMNNANTTNVRPALRVVGHTAGVPLSFTIRVSFPVLNRGLTYLTDTVPVGVLAERRYGIPTYGLSGALAASLREGVLRTLAVALDFPSGIARFNSSPADIVIGGQTFLGVGAMGSISAAEEGVELRAYGMTVGLTGVPRDAIALALGQAYQGRGGTVWEVPLDPATWQPVSDPIVIFRGRMDQMDITLGERAEVTVRLENRLTDWERPKLRRYTDADQRRRDPSDGSFRFLPATTEKEIVWPARSFWEQRR